MLFGSESIAFQAEKTCFPNRKRKRLNIKRIDKALNRCLTNLYRRHIAQNGNIRRTIATCSLRAYIIIVAARNETKTRYKQQTTKKIMLYFFIVIWGNFGL